MTQSIPRRWSRTALLAVLLSTAVPLLACGASGSYAGLPKACDVVIDGVTYTPVSTGCASTSAGAASGSSTGRDVGSTGGATSTRTQTTSTSGSATGAGATGGAHASAGTTSAGTGTSGSTTSGSGASGVSSTTGASPTSGASGTSGAQGDLAAAQAFLQPLVLGVNVERGWAWGVPGGPLQEAQYLAGLGLTHVRLFLPWSPSLDFGLGTGVPSAATVKQFFDAVQLWIQGGLTVFVDCTDGLNSSDFTSSQQAIYTHVTNMAAAAASYGFPKDKFAIGPVNEWNGNGANNSDPFATARQDLHDILRKALPGYVLTASSDYWDYYLNLEALTPLSDQRMIYSFHCYEADSAATWKSNALDPLTAWSQKYGGVPILQGEAGVGNTYQSSDATTPSVWAGNIGNMVPTMAAFRPTFWAVTYGGDWQLNKSATDATLKDGTGGNPNLEETIKTAVATAQTALVGNNGAP